MHPDLGCLCVGIPPTLPPAPRFDDTVSHAPRRRPGLTADQFKLAVRNALRYFPAEHHGVLAPEFAAELRTEGHIYMRRFRPTSYEMRAYPIEHLAQYTQCREAACMLHMIMNNLDPRVAQHPHELITYGGNGSVFQNWAQYLLVCRYLCEMTREQTLVLCSGHPTGLWPSEPHAPRVVMSNGLVIPNYSSKADYDKLYAMGNSMYGQMTAGSWCYIGPQGIVHGTTLTLLNASRIFLGTSDMTNKVFVSAGLGGMSGAQPKAGVITGCIAVVAEVDEVALDKRLAQGWVQEKITDMDALIARLREARTAGAPLSIGFLGNVVTLWERLADEDELLVELGSDQTSLHNPFHGGYYPVQLTFDEARAMQVEAPERFRALVQESLRRHVAAVNKLSARGMHFWDYGNSFLLEASRAGADVMATDGGEGFRYPSYFETFMDNVFALGFGPFRWVCTSGDPADLRTTDALAGEVIASLIERAQDDRPRRQYEDNHLWITRAEENKLVVGSQARILYADARGRAEIALAFNDAVASGKLRGAVVISRDHHDVSGTDSPFRETSAVSDGSRFTADMSVQNFCGLGMRGATWIALHNGGGVGWGEVMNGGFGLVLDGSAEAAAKAKRVLLWDVNNGVARRAWAYNDCGRYAITQAMAEHETLRVTLPHIVDDALLDAAVSEE